MNDSSHFVLDDSAMIAAGRGDALVSRLIHQAHTRPGRFLYMSACALVEADRARPGTAEHLAALPGITVLDLDLPAALAVAQGSGWAAEHTRYAALPTLDRPDGAVIATAAPGQWDGQPFRVLDLSP